MSQGLAQPDKNAPRPCTRPLKYRTLLTRRIESGYDVGISMSYQWRLRSLLLYWKKTNVMCCNSLAACTLYESFPQPFGVPSSLGVLPVCGDGKTKKFCTTPFLKLLSN